MGLILGDDVDILFGWPQGRAKRLARRGKLPFCTLPDNEIRFDRDAMLALVKHSEPIQPTPTDRELKPDEVPY
jgi:hypothetical protein